MEEEVRDGRGIVLEESTGIEGSLGAVMGGGSEGRKGEVKEKHEYKMKREKMKRKGRTGKRKRPNIKRENQIKKHYRRKENGTENKEKIR